MLTRFLVLSAGLALLACGLTTAQAPPPWEVWPDLASLAVLRLDDRVELTSSRCPWGCRYDRHSAGDSRFLRTIGDEGVIFEAEGPGAVTRIWMTQGEGISEPLDADVSIRITVDGSVVVDRPLPDFFGGVAAPFVTPLVADRETSSGGNVSWVPIPFTSSCRIALIGAANRTIWFQVHSHRLASAEGVTAFSGDEDLTTWAGWLASPGDDPWPGGPFPTTSGEEALAPGSTVELASFAGPDLLNGLLLRAPRASWPELRLQLAFDGEATVDLPLDRFFGVGRAITDGTRSLLVGVADDDDLYCYFPMPFFRDAAVRLGRDLGGDPTEVAVEWAVRRAGRAPAAASGYFGATRTVTAASTPDHDAPLLRLTGQGKWVGMFAEMGSTGGPGRDYLEGDERVFLDGSTHPLIYGTGVEDFYGGGFYFRIDSLTPTPFRTALAGMTHDLVDGQGNLTGMYRLMLTDAPTFASELRAGVEGGPWGDTSIRVDAVAWYYLRPAPALARRDRLEPGDTDSAAGHGWSANGSPVAVELDALFEDEPPTSMTLSGIERGPGASSFTLTGHGPGRWHRLRRLFDAGLSDQRATVSVDGAEKGRLAYVGENPFRRWREQDLDLGPVSGDAPTLAFEVEATGAGDPAFTEHAWELWSGWPAGTCDLTLDGRCDAADLAAALLACPGDTPECDPDAGSVALATVLDVLFAQ